MQAKDEPLEISTGPTSSDATMPALSRRELFIGAAAGATGVAAGGIGGVEAYRNPTLLRKFPRLSSPSYAHSGEDTIARLLLGHHDLRSSWNSTYLDIGACYPIYGNNTYLFYTMGGRGVLIEPNIALIPELNAQRPEDVVLNIGVGVTERKEADFYCYSDPGWNSFDKTLVDERAAKSGIKPEKVVKMPLVPINRVIEEHFRGKSPDFLSTDVEGLDLAILKTLDFQRFRPKVICAETINEDWSRGLQAVPIMGSETTNFLTEKGYEPRAMTYYNTIYIDKALLS
jgi:FkbM family methyltransferase